MAKADPEHRTIRHANGRARTTLREDGTQDKTEGRISGKVLAERARTIVRPTCATLLWAAKLASPALLLEADHWAL